MAKFFDAFNHSTGRLEKVRSYIGKGRYQVSLSVTRINIMDLRKNKNVDINFETLEELWSIKDELMRQKERLMEPSIIMPVLGINGSCRKRKRIDDISEMEPLIKRAKVERMKLVHEDGRWKRVCSTSTAGSPPVLETALPPKERLGDNTILSSCFYDNGLQVSLDLGSIVTNTKPEFSGATMETNWQPLEVNTAISLCAGSGTVTDLVLQEPQTTEIFLMICLHSCDN